MATVYPTATGNWSTRTWNDDSTGAAYGPGTPQSGDTVLLSNREINLDTDVTVALIRNIAGTNATAGGTLTVIGARTLNANLQAGTVDMVLFSASSTSLVVNGNVTGGTSAGADTIVQSTASWMPTTITLTRVSL